VRKARHPCGPPDAIRGDCGRRKQSDLLRLHLDRATGACRGAQPGALAEVEVDLVAVGPGIVELDDRVVGADAVAVVAREAVAARQAPPGLELGGLLVEPADDLVERRLTADAVELGAQRARRVGVVPRVQLVDGDGAGTRRMLVLGVTTP
jgi:hypothetical protein